MSEECVRLPWNDCPLELSFAQGLTLASSFLGLYSKLPEGGTLEMELDGVKLVIKREELLPGLASLRDTLTPIAAAKSREGTLSQQYFNMLNTLSRGISNLMDAKR